jgi:hypothetical protein
LPTKKESVMLAVLAWVTASVCVLFALRELRAIKKVLPETKTAAPFALPMERLLEQAEALRDLEGRARQGALAVSLWSRLSFAVGTFTAVLEAIRALSGGASAFAVVAAFGGGLLGFGVCAQAGRVVRVRSGALAASIARVTTELKRRAGAHHSPGSAV